MIDKASTTFEIKSVDDELRIVEGFATSPIPDKVGDIVEPRGGKFRLPLPFFGIKHYTHGGEQIGNVIKARVADDGIYITAQIPKNSGLDYVEKAWLQIKAGLLRGLSIGFRADGMPGLLKNGGRHYKSWHWEELTAVPIAAHQECSIAVIKALSNEPFKSLDSPRSSLSGKHKSSVVNLFPSGVPENHESTKDFVMPNLQESLSTAEKKRDDLAAAHRTALDAVLAKGMTLDADEQEQQSKNLGEIEKLDEYIDFMKRSEATLSKAKPVRNGEPMPFITTQINKEPGIAFAQTMRCLYKAGGVRYIAGEIAAKEYRDDPRIAMVLKADVPAASTISGTWGAGFLNTDGGPFQEFLEFVRPLTIVGRMPGTTSVEFLKPVGVQTGGGEGYWVGEGIAKPLTSLAATPTSLPPTKVANIIAVTEEWLKYASANNDRRIRDSMAGALQQRLDEDFVDPAVTVTSGVRPASITNGAATQAATGTGDHGDVITDFKYLMSVVSVSGIRRQPVLIVDSTTALALGMMINSFGQKIFPNVSMTGGTFEGGIPVIVSDSVPHDTNGGMAILVNAPEILVADEGGFDIAMSRDASLLMTDTNPNTDMDSVTPDHATGLVSMFQTNSVAFRAERAIGWKRARTTAVAYVTAVNWGAA